MIISLLAFFASPFGRIIGYFLSAMTIFTVLFTLWKIHDANVRHGALLEYNKRQMEQVVKDQKKMIEDNQHLEENREQIIQELQTQHNKLDQVTTAIQKRLSSPKVLKTDRPASKVIRDTFRELNEGKL